MSNQYDMRIRDADMYKRKALMLASISDAFVTAGGTGVLALEVEQFIENCARNGINIHVVVVTGPYAQKRHTNGTVNYS